MEKLRDIQKRPKHILKHFRKIKQQTIYFLLGQSFISFIFSCVSYIFSTLKAYNDHFLFPVSFLVISCLHK